jgi:uncharacterized protein (TIGR02996 family)
MKSLEQQLVENPNDMASWAVYADYLMQQGDACGEALALELAGRLEEAEAIRKQHLSQWLGEIEIDGEPMEEPDPEDPDWYWGKPGPKKTVSLVELGEAWIRLKWLGGFVIEAQILQGRAPSYDDSGYSYQSYELPEFLDVLKRFLAAPSVRFLRHLHLEPGDYLMEDFYQQLPSSLRSLYIGPLDPYWVSPNRIGSLAGLSERLPFLERLKVHGHSEKLELGSGWTQLKALELGVLELDEAVVEKVTPEAFPVLEELQLCCFWGSYYRERLRYSPENPENQRLAREEEAASFRPLRILKQNFSKLHILKLQGVGKGAATIKTLLMGPFSKHLKHLEIAGCELDREAAIVLWGAFSIRKLEQLGLELDEEGTDFLKEKLEFTPIHAQSYS